MSAEVHRLQKAGFIREVKEATWVANPVMVPKKDTDVLRMCIDFTDLNNATPKDCFHLLRIDHLVDSTMGYEIFNFLDTFSRYHQI